MEAQMTPKELAAVFEAMRAVSSQLQNDDDRELAEAFILKYESFNAEFWAYALGALVPQMSEELSPRATFDLKYDSLTGPIDQLIEVTPVSSGGGQHPEYERANLEAGVRKATALKIAKDFIRKFFEELQKNICSGKVGTKELSIQSIGAGLAASISTFTTTQPVAIAIATAVLVLVMLSGKGAFCRMDFGEFWGEVEKSVSKPKARK
jgi:hypothetical protein